MAGEIHAQYFDGRSAKAHRVRVRHDGDALLISGDGIERRVPPRELQWPERTRHGPRVAHLADGASLQADDAAAWDAFAAAQGRGDSAVVRAQQSWRWAAASLAGFVVVLVMLLTWGLPVVSRGVVALLPATLDEQIGTAVFESLDGELLKPSKLPPERQRAVRERFAQVLAAQPPGSVPAYRIEFRSSRIGANAFALPGGTIVVIDELVGFVDGDADVVAGVLGHELGHVKHRHGMRLVVQVGALSALASLVLGDFSTILAGAPVILGQAAYSRDAEREADAEAARLLRDAGLSPALMVTFFEKMGKKEGSGDRSLLGIAIGSHPADDERIRYFREQAALPR